MSPPPISKPRERRAHKKSRRGCANCKLRRVKCGEEAPACAKCKAFGVECTYGGNESGLRFAGEGSFALETPIDSTAEDALCVSWMPPKPRSADQMQVTLRMCNQSAGWSSLGSSGEDLYACRLGLADLDILTRFRERTVLTVGTPSMSLIYQQEVFRLACSHVFLKHIVITLTSLHDRYLCGTQTIDQTTALHWYKGTALFKQVLSKPIREESKDALWATAALLGAIQFAAFEAATPEEAWPLKPYAASDLDWLKMSDGKKAVWKITDPMRAGSAFRRLKIDHSWLYRPLDYKHKDLIDITRDFVDLYNLGPNSTGDNNPYHSAAMAQARSIGVQCTKETLIEFLSFLGNVNPKLLKLIDRKDPKALLLIACWYAKMYKYQWWIQRRGLIEGKALCMYLDRFHGDDARIQRLLLWPKREFGMEPKETGTDWREETCLSASTVLCVV